MWAATAAPAGAGASGTPAPEEICRLIAHEAKARQVPHEFFARLIWQESRFNGAAVSPKGAQGIAQFMPTTAAERALQDPFDLPSALAESAAFLEELAARFGNWGLAAAAYNAGPERVRRWLAGAATLPLETRHYVKAITGVGAEDWKRRQAAVRDAALLRDAASGEACLQLAARPAATRTTAAKPAAAAVEAPPTHPWGMQVASHPSREAVLGIYGRLQLRFSRILGNRQPMVLQHRAPARAGQPLYAVRIGADSKAEAERLCADYRTAGGVCWVIRN